MHNVFLTPMTDTSDPSSTQDTPSEGGTFDADAYTAVVDVARRRIAGIDKAKAELKTQKEMLESLFLNDAQYQEADKKVKDVSKERSIHKNRITKQPQAQVILDKIKDLKAEIAENNDMLAVDLMQYYQTAGVTEIEDENGNVQEFEIVVKLKKKRNSA